MHLRVDGPHGFVLGEGSRSRCRRSGSGRAPGLPERDGTASPAAPRGARAGGAGLERGDPDRPGTGRTGDRSPAELHPPPCGAVRRPLRIRHAVGGRTRRRAAAPGAVPNGRPPPSLPRHHSSMNARCWAMPAASPSAATAARSPSHPPRGGRLHRVPDDGAYLEALPRASLTSLTGVTAVAKLIVHWPRRPVPSVTRPFGSRHPPPLPA